MQILAEADYGTAPPLIARQVLAAVGQELESPDPFAEIKRRTNQQVLELLPALRERIRQSDDPFRTAAKLALGGNIIDFGVPRPFALEPTIDELLRSEPKVDEIDRLRERASAAKRVLYLADNAGEIAFDRLLIEQLGAPERVTVAVRGGPALNDALRADAEQVGLGDLARVIDSGLALAGTDVDRSSAELQQAVSRADLVIVKGQGNFETLHDDDRYPTFFLFMVKCAVVASFTGLAEGSAVVASRSALAQGFSA